MSIASSGSGESYTKDSLDDVGFESLVPNCLKNTRKCKSNSSLERIPTSLSMPDMSLESNSVESSSVYDGNMSFDPFNGRVCSSSPKAGRAIRTSPFGKKTYNKSVRFSSPLTRELEYSPTPRLSLSAGDESMETINLGLQKQNLKQSFPTAHSDIFQNKNQEHAGFIGEFATKSSASRIGIQHNVSGRGYPEQNPNSNDNNEDQSRHHPEDNFEDETWSEKRKLFFKLLFTELGLLKSTDNARFFDVTSKVFEFLKAQAEASDMTDRSEQMLRYLKISSETQQKYFTLQSNNIKLIKALKFLETTKKQLTEEIKGKEKDAKALYDEISHLRKQNDSLKLEIVRIEESYTKKLERLPDLGQFESLENVITGCCAELGRYCSNPVPKSEILEQLQKVLGEKDKDVSKLDLENKNLSSQIQESALQHDRDIQQISNFEETIEKQKLLIQEQKARMELLEAKDRTTTAETNALKKSLKQANADLAQEKTANQEISKDNQALKEVVQYHEFSLAKAEEETEKLKGVVANFEAKERDQRALLKTDNNYRICLKELRKYQETLDKVNEAFRREMESERYNSEQLKFYLLNVTNAVILKLSEVFDAESFVSVKKKVRQFSVARVCDESTFAAVEHVILFIVKSLGTLIEGLKEQCKENVVIENVLNEELERHSKKAQTNNHKSIGGMDRPGKYKCVKNQNPSSAHMRKAFR